jgi:hypothetical protein
MTQLVAGLSSLKPGFAPWSAHVGIVVGRVALGHVFSEFFGFMMYCASPSEFLSFLVHPPELSGKYQQRHLVAKQV